YIFLAGTGSVWTAKAMQPHLLHEAPQLMCRRSSEIRSHRVKNQRMSGRRRPEPQSLVCEHGDPGWRAGCLPSQIKWESFQMKRKTPRLAGRPQTEACEGREQHPQLPRPPRVGGG